MKAVTNPNVKTLAEGKSFIAKEMAANKGDLLPKHLASSESILMMQKGVCVIHFEDSDHLLNSNEVYIIAANVIHQIEATQDFKAVHVMPKDIKFEFFK